MYAAYATRNPSSSLSNNRLSSILNMYSPLATPTSVGSTSRQVAYVSREVVVPTQFVGNIVGGFCR